GFLTGIGPENVEQQLSRLCQGDYRTIDRVFLKADLIRSGEIVRTLRALNDVFVNRADKPKLSSLTVWLDDELINDFLADGLIVASPAGSTAYSLAAGGPIVEPSSRTLLLTPICPHSLTERPLVVPDDRTIRIRVNPRNPLLLLSADGMDSQHLEPGDEIVIACDRTRASLIQLSESSFFQSLRSKLDWGTNTSRRRRDDDAA
ncbi:MAG: NAD(+) kinase, partial [Chitinivibrionales bacterium]|nr:NAD(+) kinase [Chitinivibrionales bacterium]